MEERRLGRTGHMSSIVAFGAAALSDVSQDEADEAIEMAISRGVNHIDVSPSYGRAEARLGPWLEHNRSRVFLACKTGERSRTGAWESIKRSLETLKVDHFDLYQFHGVSDLETLGAVLSPAGALQAALEARQQGLVKHIGITGHRPFVQVEALQRFDFDTVLFPVNAVLAAHRNDYNDFRLLLETARQKDAGMIGIKAVARRPWEAGGHMYRTWYEPFVRQPEIERTLWYALTQGITTAAMPGDLRLWPMVLDSAERYRPLDTAEQAELVREMRRYRPIFPRAEF